LVSSSALSDHCGMVTPGAWIFLLVKPGADRVCWIACSRNQSACCSEDLGIGRGLTASATWGVSELLRIHLPCSHVVPEREANETRHHFEPGLRDGFSERSCVWLTVGASSV
jgi:hypothetical protein